MNNDNIKNEILQRFVTTFGEGENANNKAEIFFSPGRVNLIGEHIDYNGGYVFPCALDIGIYGVFRKRSDNLVRLASGNFDLPVDFNLHNNQNEPKHNWGNYPKGVIQQFLQKGHELSGFEAYVWGDLPNGAGLSSSASLTTLVAAALNDMFNLGVPPSAQAIMCQYAEHFNGVNCGVMDPFACAMGKKDHAILLSCGSLEYSYAPLNLGDYRIVIVNTNYRRSLTDSKYNERLKECKEALKDLQTVAEIDNICDLTPDNFEKYKNAITNPTAAKRAEHAVYENYRTKALAGVLAQGRMGDMFKLMKDSHDSLRELYEVTGDALDALLAAIYAYALNHPQAVLGARMTGAGFGGCAVSIIHKDAIEDFTTSVTTAYTEKTELEPSFYEAQVSQGAGKLE